MRQNLANNHTYGSSIPHNVNISSIPVDQNYDYELQIRDVPIYWCFSCQRILFKEQALCLDASTNSHHFYCQCCKMKLQNEQIPSIAQSNHMKVSIVPNVITQVAPIERRFLAQIHVFMTVYLLPGNTQLGERGIVINLPTKPEEFIADKNTIPLLAITFEGTSKTSNDAVQHFIRLDRIYAALQWLKAHNPLYANLDLQSSTFQNTDTTTMPLDCNINGMNIEDIINNVTESVPQLNIPWCNEQPIIAYDILHGEVS